jgi:PAS domain S-box-containing protein
MTKLGSKNNTNARKDSVLTDGHKKALVELDRYKILVESIEDYAIFLLDKNGYILTWNKGAQKAKGYKADEIIGQHFSKFYQEEDIAADKPALELELAIRRGRVEDEDWRVRKDGSKFWANVVITTLYDGAGNHIGFAKVTRDLTQRKQQEDAVRHTNVQLRQQQRELELLNNSKDEFISLASHQLRTPATAVKQLLGLLTEGLYGELPSHIANILDRAYESNERQINIINSLLKVAQIDAGKVILHRSSVDMTQMAQDLLDEYSDTFFSRKQNVELEVVGKQPITAYIDAEYMRMAISNLIDNASKYTHRKGKIWIRISQTSTRALVSISDSGVGISRADQKDLFTKFQRIPNEMSQAVGGSGLGLYWVQKVVELHSGTIEIDSEIGKGTTINLLLPKEAEQVYEKNIASRR